MSSLFEFAKSLDDAKVTDARIGFGGNPYDTGICLTVDIVDNVCLTDGYSITVLPSATEPQLQSLILSIQPDETLFNYAKTLNPVTVASRPDMVGFGSFEFGVSISRNGVVAVFDDSNVTVLPGNVSPYKLTKLLSGLGLI